MVSPWWRSNGWPAPSNRFLGISLARITLGDKSITEANAGSLGIDWNALETIFRQPSEYRFFDPAAAPGFLNLRDYFTGPFDTLNARFVPHNLQGLFLDVHGEHRNDTNSTRWVFWFRADGEFLPIPEPTTIALTLFAAGLGCATIRRRTLGPHRRY